MKKERVLNKKENLNQVQGAPHLVEGKDHQKKVGVIIIVAVLAVGLLSILLLLGPKLFVGKAISFELTDFDVGEAGIPPPTGTIAPGDSLAVLIAANVGTSNGNVFEFTLYYDPTELTFNEFVSHSEIIIVEMIPFSPDGETTWELKIVGTVQPPLGYQDVDNSGVVEFGNIFFTVNEDIDTSSLSIGFYLFNVLNKSNNNIVTEFFGALFELATVCGNGIVEVGEECDDNNIVDGDGCSNSCQLELTTAELCDTEIDDDGDGLINCYDEIDCKSDLACKGQSCNLIDESKVWVWTPLFDGITNSYGCCLPNQCSSSACFDYDVPRTGEQVIYLCGDENKWDVCAQRYITLGVLSDGKTSICSVVGPDSDDWGWKQIANEAAYCDDGVDNDRDGNIDGVDSDCSGDILIGDINGDEVVDELDAIKLAEEYVDILITGGTLSLDHNVNCDAVTNELDAIKIAEDYVNALIEGITLVYPVCAGGS